MVLTEALLPIPPEADNFAGSIPLGFDSHIPNEMLLIPNGDKTQLLSNFFDRPRVEI